MICEEPDYMFPFQVDIFHPLVEQGAYGNVKKQWILDRTLAASFNAMGRAGVEQLTPNVNITQEQKLIGRMKTDVRVSSQDANNSLTNIILTNIRDRNCNQIYMETSGPRAGKPTIFEVFSQEPFVGPFGGIEYYNLVIKRSENQAVNI